MIRFILAIPFYAVSTCIMLMCKVIGRIGIDILRIGGWIDGYSKEIEEALQSKKD